MNNEHLFDSDDEFEIVEDKVEEVEDVSYFDDVLDVIDVSRTLFDEKNMKSMISIMLQNYYCESMLQSKNFTLKVNNFSNIIRNHNTEEKCNFKNRLSFSFRPIIKIKKTVLNVVIDNYEDTGGDAKYDTNEGSINVQNLATYIDGIHTLLKNKNISMSEREDRLNDIVRPFENTCDVNSVCTNMDAYYIWGDELGLNVETVRLVGMDDKVKIIGISNVVDLNNNKYIVFDLGKNIQDVESLQEGSIVFYKSNKTCQVQSVDEKRIKLSTGYVFDKENIFVNDFFLHSNNDNDNIYNPKDLYTSNSHIFSESQEELDTFLSSSEVYMKHVSGLVTNVSNLNLFYKEFPLLENENINDKIQETINNYKKPTKHYNISKNKTKRQVINGNVYEKMEEFLVKNKNKATDKNEYDDLLKKAKIELRDIKKDFKKDDIKIDQMYKNIKKYDSLHEALYDANSTTNKVRLFAHHQNTYPLYWVDDEWVFDIDRFKSEIKETYKDVYFLDMNDIVIKNKKNLKLLQKIKKIETIVETLEHLSDDYEYKSVDYSSNYKTPKPFTFTSINIVDESGFRGDETFQDTDDLFDYNDNVVSNYNINKYTSDVDDVEINTTEYNVENLVKTTTYLLGIKLEEKDNAFIIEHLHYLDANSKANEVKKNFLKNGIMFAKQKYGKGTKGYNDFVNSLNTQLDNKWQASFQEYNIYYLFSLLVIFIQIKLPEIIIDIGNPNNCNNKIGFMGYPLEVNRLSTIDNNTLITFLSCCIKNLAKNNVLGYASFEKSNQKDIIDKLVDNIKSILDKIPNLQIFLDKTRRVLEKEKANKIRQMNYWNSFRPVSYKMKDNATNNSASFILSQINNIIDSNKILNDYCCLRKLDDKLYDNILDESLKGKINNLMKKDTINVKLPIRFLVKDSNRDVFIEHFKKVDFKKVDIIETNKEDAPIEDDQTEFDSMIKRFKEINDKFDFVLETNDGWNKFSKESDAIFDTIKEKYGTMKNFNIFQKIFRNINDYSNETIRTFVLSFLSNTIGSIIGKNFNNFKINENIKKPHFKHATRATILNIKATNFTKVVSNAIPDDDEFVDDSREYYNGVSHLYLKTSDATFVFKNVKVLLYILIKTLENIKNDSVVIKVIEMFLTKFNNIKTITQITNYFEKQREDNKQSKMVKINKYSEESRMMYGELKKRNMNTEILDVYDKNEVPQEEIYDFQYDFFDDAVDDPNNDHDE